MKIIIMEVTAKYIHNLNQSLERGEVLKRDKYNNLIDSYNNGKIKIINEAKIKYSILNQ